jgi:pimeloyl-ACP methyl ester carboxylesterase
VVAYDHRGHGQSDHPPYGYRMARLAADTHEVIEALGLSDITVVAHSMGCGVAPRTGIFMVTAQMLPGERAEILKQMLLTQREAASLLMFSNATQDWRDLLPSITVPALVIGGGASLFSPASIENLAAVIPGAVVRIISAADRGSHLSFLENPSAVNGVIRAFLDSTA